MGSISAGWKDAASEASGRRPRSSATIPPGFLGLVGLARAVQGLSAGGPASGEPAAAHRQRADARGPTLAAGQVTGSRRRSVCGHPLCAVAFRLPAVPWVASRRPVCGVRVRCGSTCADAGGHSPPESVCVIGALIEDGVISGPVTRREAGDAGLRLDSSGPAEGRDRARPSDADEARPGTIRVPAR